MSILNLVSGMAMYTSMTESGKVPEGDLAPFNEAMCEGDATEDIFGSDFIQARCTVHGVGVEEYEEIVLQPLKPLFEMDYDNLQLYFDTDMFCQINLITILGYLDKNDYSGTVTLHLSTPQGESIGSALIVPSGFYRVYREVLIDHKFPECVLPEVMLDGVIRYLQLQNRDNEIRCFIRENLSIPQEELLNELFSRYSDYGLGDTQLEKMIEMEKYEAEFVS